MFQNLKSRNHKASRYKDLPNAGAYPSTGFSPAASASSFQVKGNEATRLVRCRICGFPCDRERDVKQKEESWAGLGVSYGQQLTAGTSIGDRRVPAAGSVATAPDKYYARNVQAGCPCCGSYLYWT